MSLNDQTSDGLRAVPAGGPTLDTLFRRAAVRRPDALALVDPPNRPAFTDGAPRRLTYLEADAAISSLAGQLQGTGLQSGDPVALMLGNTVESVLSLLAVLRAGMVAVPISLLMGRADAADALTRVGAKALIACGRVGTLTPATRAMDIAAAVFTIRSVCGFGDSLPDGFVTLDLDSRPQQTKMPAGGGNPGRRCAAITFDTSHDGIVPVARNHAQLIAGGLAVMLESRAERDAVILTTVMTSSFAGLAVGVIPWLLSGGTLVLHHPFDAAVLAAQCEDLNCSIVNLPAALLPALADSGRLASLENAKAIVALWRAPERLAQSRRWEHDSPALVDIQAFGEIGLIPARRDHTGAPAAMTPAREAAADAAGSGADLIAFTSTAAGTVALRGAMVPRHAYPPGMPEHPSAPLPVASDGFIDTGFACRRDGANRLVVTAPPAGMVAVGGQRMFIQTLQQLAQQAGPSATLAAFPDLFAGQRLAGSAGGADNVEHLLAAAGAGPLVVDAFRRPRSA